MTIYSLDTLLFLFETSLFFHVQLDHISKVPTQIMGGKYYICSSLTFQNHPHPFSVVSHWSWNRWQMNFVSPSKQMTSAPKSLPGVIYILKCRGKIELLFLSKFPESVVNPFHPYKQMGDDVTTQKMFSVALALLSWFRTDSYFSDLGCLWGWHVRSLGLVSIEATDSQRAPGRRHWFFFSIILLGFTSRWHSPPGSLHHSLIQATFIELLQGQGCARFLRSQK